MGLAREGRDGERGEADMGTGASPWVDVAAGDIGLCFGLYVLFSNETNFLFNTYILNIMTAMAQILSLG